MAVAPAAANGVEIFTGRRGGSLAQARDIQQQKKRSGTLDEGEKRDGGL